MDDDNDVTPVAGMPDMEMREGILPDGARMVVAVKKGLPQGEVDLLAAQVWQDVPE